MVIERVPNRAYLFTGGKWLTVRPVIGDSAVFSPFRSFISISDTNPVGGTSAILGKAILGQMILGKGE